MDRIYYRIMLLVALLVMLSGLSAQIGTYYTFVQSSFDYQNIVGYMLPDAMVDEGLSDLVMLGFTFPYGNNNYTHFKVSSNGWINPGSNLNSPWYANDITTLNLLPIIAPLWDDLGMNNGAVQYNYYGAAPHRYVVVQWSAAHWNYQASNEYNFQARLHETGQIDFIYGPHTGIPGTTASATIGINKAPGGTGNFLSVYPGFPAHTSSSNALQTIVTPVPEDVMYIFIPRTFVQQDAAIVNLSGPFAPHQNETVAYTVTVGNAGMNELSSTSYVVRLMQGETELSTRMVNSTMPGMFINETIYWTPTATGIQQIYAKIEFAADQDSTNNFTVPMMVSVLPPVANEDLTQMDNPLILNAFPNPVYGDNGRIDYTLKQSDNIELAVYDLKGRKVRTLQNGFKSAGNHQQNWEMVSDDRLPLANGMYFIRLTSSNSSITQKMLLLKAE